MNELTTNIKYVKNVKTYIILVKDHFKILKNTIKYLEIDKGWIQNFFIDEFLLIKKI